MATTSYSDPSDAQAGAELARANLLRLRGDYLAAEAECLKVLRQFPNNAGAHTLLGEICAEKGDLEQSLQWYELSLDLAEDHTVRERANTIRSRMQDRERAVASKEMGVPADRARKNGYLAFMLVVILITVGFACYSAGRQQEPDGPANEPHVLPPIQPVPSTLVKLSGSGQGVGSDLVLYERLRASSAEGGSLLLVLQDPRSKAITLSYDAQADGDLRPVGARLAVAALQNSPDALIVTVRAMRGGNLIYTADVLRSKYDDTQQSGWQSENKQTPDAWIGYVLDNEWSAVEKSEASGSSVVPPKERGPDGSAGSQGSDGGNEGQSQSGSQASGDQGQSPASPETDSSAATSPSGSEAAPQPPTPSPSAPTGNTDKS